MDYFDAATRPLFPWSSPPKRKTCPSVLLLLPPSIPPPRQVPLSLNIFLSVGQSPSRPSSLKSRMLKRSVVQIRLECLRSVPSNNALYVVGPKPLQKMRIKIEPGHQYNCTQRPQLLLRYCCGPLSCCWPATIALPTLSAPKLQHALRLGTEFLAALPLDLQ